jgi:hypothetical protein
MTKWPALVKLDPVTEDFATRDVPLSFATIAALHRITPIHGCPGRYILHGAEHRRIEDLVGAAIDVHRHSSPNARDPIAIAPLVDGGVISYCRTDGTYLHTLNDAAGFARKLAQLGIVLDRQ